VIIMSFRMPFLLPALASVVALATAACAMKPSGPLPGDSVAADGAITLSPPRFSSAPGGPAATRDARDALDPIASRLFPPELVMEHQNEIGLTVAQRDAMTKEIVLAQRDLTRLQWDMQSEKEKLVKALDSDQVDEAAANASAARVMDLETKIKSRHLAMLIHVKNGLTPEQERRLRAVRDEERCATQAAQAPASGSASAAAPTR
jgi:Spy/CpxP family protein refolding chaperone